MAVLLLAACAASPPAAVLRDARVPMTSLVDWTPARLLGRWTEAAHLAPAGRAPCAPGGLEVASGPGGLHLNGRMCLAGRARILSGGLQQSGPGRFRAAGQEWWVLWADHGDRTMVLADPAGGFAMVLDKGRISPDRLEAARRILQFNGFDPGLLR